MDLQAVASGTQESRVEVLRQILDYPLKQRDPEGSRFWFLRPGADKDEAEDTCPIAVGFYSELDGLSNDDIKQFLTADEQQREIYGHYTGRIIPNQPVMYLLLPEGDSPAGTLPERLGQVAMILPTDGKLRQRQIQTFSWADEDLQARLNRLRQDTLARTNRMKDAALSVIPLVEWAFYKPITTAKELAQKLAEVSRRIERVIPDVYRAEPNDGYLRGLLRSFQKELLPTLKLEPENEKDYSFADIYAQTIAYGLFTARVFSYTIDERRRRDEADPARKETDFNREDAWELLPETNPFLRRLFRDVSKAVGKYAASTKKGTASDESPVIADELIDAIAEVVSILRAAKMDAILEDFRAKMNREDIVIRFYEDFLAAYKPRMRERRGVYYTPEPVVSYMVRSVDILLKEKFDKPLGLADPEVIILDPACGTGTFLLWIFQEIYKKFQENPGALTEGMSDQGWSAYVQERLLPRIFGFELLMAPYAIAHLKLGLFLEETGYQFDSGKRLGVYLTNSLENTIRKAETLFEEFIAEESEQAAEVKQNLPVMLILGNPPYSSISENQSPFIEELMSSYKEAVRSEVSLVALSDDYIKFIRFAHHKIQKTGAGIFSFISNRGFLSGVNHRGMREELLRDFSQITILDLHGDTNVGETPPQGKENENVFDIQQGVCISTFVKNSERKSIKHGEIWGTRSEKYEALKRALESKDSSQALEIVPRKPYYFFYPLLASKELEEEYKMNYSLDNIFIQSSCGIKTHRDSLLIDFSEEEVFNRFSRIISLPEDEARKEYAIEDTKHWSFGKAVRIIRSRNIQDYLKPILYRPFDFRHIYYNKDIIEKYDSKYPTMKHLLRDNIALLSSRTHVASEFSAAFVSSNIVEMKTGESTRCCYCFPLYTYSDSDGLQASVFNFERQANLSKEFIAHVQLKIGYSPDPLTVFHYIYAILHSPAYRSRYSEFLKIEFPRIPVVSNRTVFQQLVAYGEELVALHLMKSSKLDTPITQFVKKGNCCIDPGHPKYDENSSSVLINKKGDKFVGVSKAIWELYIGGYQVCQKWLKDRKGRTLRPDDIIHYQRIIVALQETVLLMQQIDEAIPGFPLL